MRFRLLECSSCGTRTWTVDNEQPPVGVHADDGSGHCWWERETFFAVDNGPGLAPTQVPAP